MNRRGLSRHEQRELDRIAAGLDEDAPELAAMLDARYEAGPAPAFGVLSRAMAAGVGCLVTGMCLDLPLLVFVGMIGAVVIALLPAVRPGSETAAGRRDAGSGGAGHSDGAGPWPEPV